MRKANRMISAFSHNPRIPSQQNGLALVNVLAAIFRLHKGIVPAFDGWSLPSDAGSVLINKVSGFVYRAKIANAIVRLIAVDMVNFLSWLFAAREKPSYAMSEIRNTFVFNAKVAFEIVTRNIARLYHPAAILKPNKFASVRTVFDGVFNRFRYLNHAEIVSRGAF